MTIVYLTDPRFEAHDAGAHHPERPARLHAVERGIELSGVSAEVVRVAPDAADVDAITRVHPGSYLDLLRQLDSAGGGHIDADTRMGAESFDAALLAAGAGWRAVAELEAGAGEVAFCAVRPPGHHATPSRPMGFCLINNVAVTAAALADRGERVLIVDVDAHHGNGTQDVFYADPRVHFVSLHQFPCYPGTGALSETGDGEGAGATTNVPLPMGTTGDVYRRVVDEVLHPLAESWQPTWLLISAGFDAHRRDPLTDLGLAAGDYADIVRSLLELVPRARTILFLEGGYDLAALSGSVAATFAALAGERTAVVGDAAARVGLDDERPTAGGPGQHVVDGVIASRRRFA